ncbi:MAG: GntR family transcriptional regulator [Erysipelotrichaceae bacterium]|jgi:GntR family transcriptional regulator|nr:GntR family transcriptional regulator [Erysipelotrichaceae bacterium]MCR5095828.1 GntR family transcriptional regulator [Erysipelotrichaceae bacterium]
MPREDYKMPIYLQLREIIRNKIEDGEYMPGTAIPSENKLAESFGINRITIRNAVDALVNEGLLRRIQGKGVFVVGNKNELSIEEHAGFVGDAIRNDTRISVKELQKSERQAGNKYANLFGLELEDEIYYIRQMHSINNVETSIEEFFLPKKVLPSLDMINSSVFTFRDIMSFYGIKLKKMTQSLRIINGSAKIRKQLNIPDGVAVLLLECDFYNENNEVIAHSISNIRSDMQSFTVSMHKTHYSKD